jgi:hypothetical protein
LSVDSAVAVLSFESGIEQSVGSVQALVALEDLLEAERGKSSQWARADYSAVLGSR